MLMAEEQDSCSESTACIDQVSSDYNESSENLSHS